MCGFGNLLTTRTAMFAVTGIVAGALITKAVRNAYGYFYGDAEKEDLSSKEQSESDFNSSGPEMSTGQLRDVEPSITDDEGMNSLSLKANVEYSYRETKDGSSTLEKQEYDSNGGFGLELATGLLRDVEPSVFQEKKDSGHQTSVSVAHEDAEPRTEKPFSDFTSDQVTTSDLDAFEMRESGSKSPSEDFTGNEEKFVVFREKQSAAVLETAFGEQAAEIAISALDFSEQHFDDLSATSGENDGYSFSPEAAFLHSSFEDVSASQDDGVTSGNCLASEDTTYSSSVKSAEGDLSLFHSEDDLSCDKPYTSVFFSLKDGFVEIQSKDLSSEKALCEGDCSATTEELFDENDENSLSLGQKLETSPSFTELEAFMEGEARTSPVSAEDCDYVSDGSEMLHDECEAWSEPESDLDSSSYDDSVLPYMDEGTGCKLGLETDVKELNCENGAPLSGSNPDTEWGEDVGPSRTTIIWENQDDDQIGRSTIMEENFEERDEKSLSLEENEEMSPTDEGLEDVDGETSVFSEEELSEGDSDSDSEKNYDLLSASFEGLDEDETSCSKQEDEASLPEHESHAEYLTSVSPAAETLVSEQKSDEGNSSPSWSPRSCLSDGEGETPDALNDDEEQTSFVTEDRFNHKPDDSDAGETISSVLEVDVDLSSEDTSGLTNQEAELKRLDEFDEVLLALGLQDLVCDNVASGSSSSPHDESLNFLEDESEAPLASQDEELSEDEDGRSSNSDEELSEKDGRSLNSGDEVDVDMTWPDMEEGLAEGLELASNEVQKLWDFLRKGETSQRREESIVENVSSGEDEDGRSLNSDEELSEKDGRSLNSDEELSEDEDGISLNSDEELSEKDGLTSGQAEIKRLNAFDEVLLELGIQDLVCNNVAFGSSPSISGKELDEVDVDINWSDIIGGVANGFGLDTNAVQTLWDVAKQCETSRRREGSIVENVSSGEDEDGRSSYEKTSVNEALPSTSSGISNEPTPHRQRKNNGCKVKEKSSVTTGKSSGVNKSGTSITGAKARSSLVSGRETEPKSSQVSETKASVTSGKHLKGLKKRWDMSLQLWCLSFRQPYAGLVLNGLKTLESRWRPLLTPLQNQTLAIHIAWQDWEGEDWKSVLSGPLGMSGTQIQALQDSGERFGRGVVAGLVDVGETWLCTASLQGEELHRLEQAALLIGLQDKHLTHLTNPRWLTQPLRTRGGRDLWTVEIPAEFLPQQDRMQMFRSASPW